MTTEEILTELKIAWMNNEQAAALFGFTRGDDFDNTYSRVSVLALIFYVVAYVIALKETLLSQWKEEVRQVGLSTHYGTASWWVAAAKEWQNGDPLTVIDGRMGYATVDPSHRLITAASVTAEGRTLTLKVAKKTTFEGGYTPLSTDEKTNFEGYVEQIKPLGIYVDVRSSPANNIEILGSIGYDAELDLTNVKKNVREAILAELDNLPFNGTLYISRLNAAIVAVDGVVFCNIGSVLVDGTSVEVSTVPYSGYFSLSLAVFDYRPIAQ